MADTVKKLRYLLYPFSVLYGLGVRLRNRLFDKDVFRSIEFDLPVICVGNLSVGGTGKTPMVEYLIRLLQGEHKVAVLSRGYRRKTRGFVLAGENTTAAEIGDEPMQIHVKYPNITVAVSELRVIGIPMILQHHPEVDVVILDDAFQHREVRAGLNILLTEYRQPYARDLLLPAGNLRDTRSSSERADIIVVTKCDPGMTLQEKEKLIQEIAPSENQSVYFTAIGYGKFRSLSDNSEVSVAKSTNVLLVCGIAKPALLKDAVSETAHLADLLIFRDHHRYTHADIDSIKKRFSGIPVTEKAIITTEKDAVKLKEFGVDLSGLPIYVLPVEHRFLFSEEENFNRQVIEFTEKKDSSNPQAQLE